MSSSDTYPLWLPKLVFSLSRMVLTISPAPKSLHSTDTSPAVHVKDIFATGSSPLQIQGLQLEFDSPPLYGKNLDWHGYTVHDAANILLRFLLQLPGGVIPLEFHERFCCPMKGWAATVEANSRRSSCTVEPFDHGLAVRTYRALIRELPALNRHLLFYLLDLLHVFEDETKSNNMTAQRLAIIFQPGILSNPQHGSTIAERQLSEDVMSFLIKKEEEFRDDE